MSKEDQEQLIADHFLFKEGDRFLQACNLNRNWPNNRGIYHNNDKTFLVWVNEEDQLRIISMQKGADVKSVYLRLTTALEAFETKGCSFAKDSHLGTAMRASVHIQLPQLAKKENKAEFEAIANKFNV